MIKREREKERERKRERERGREGLGGSDAVAEGGRQNSLREILSGEFHWGSAIV